MIVVTTPFLAGHRIVESKGMVFGLVVRSRGLGGNVMASLRSLGGGEIHEYTSLLEDTRRQALDRLVSNATLPGANAILSMRFDSSELSGTMSEIVAYGTAVIVAPDASAATRLTRRSNERRPGGRAAAGRSRSGDVLAGLATLTSARGKLRLVRHRDLARRVRAGPDRRRHAPRAGPLPLGRVRPVPHPGRSGRRRTARHQARTAVPPHRRGLRGPDVRSPDARLDRSVVGRTAVRRRGLSVRRTNGSVH